MLNILVDLCFLNTFFHVIQCLFCYHYLWATVNVKISSVFEFLPSMTFKSLLYAISSEVGMRYDKVIMKFNQ